MERQTRYKRNMEIAPPKVCAALRSIAKWKSEKIDEEEMLNRLDIGVTTYLRFSSLSNEQFDEIGERFEDEVRDIIKRIQKLAKEIHRGRWAKLQLKDH